MTTDQQTEIISQLNDSLEFLQSEQSLNKPEKEDYRNELRSFLLEAISQTKKDDVEGLRGTLAKLEKISTSEFDFTSHIRKLL